MLGDPFADLTDTMQDRKKRDNLVRRQKLIAAGSSLGAILLVALSTGVGGALGGWIIEKDPGNLLDRFLGGMSLGLVGGVFCFLMAFGRYIRKSILKEVRGGRENIDVGSMMFWAMLVGTASFGTWGATVGYSGKGAFDLRVIGCTVIVVSLSL